MAKKTNGFGTVKVNSEELKAKAEDAYVKIGQYKETLEQVTSTIAASSSYWTGSAGDLFREALSLQISEMQEALEEYRKYPKELLQYAGIYSEVIMQTESLAEAVKIEMF